MPVATRPLLRGLFLVGLGLWVLLPLATLVVVAWSGGWYFPSLLGVHPGAAPWTALPGAGQRLAAAIGTSVATAAATGTLAAGAGWFLGRRLSQLSRPWRGWGAGAAFLPVAIPPLALGVGLQYTLLTLGLGGTFGGVLLAHLIPAVGYTSLFFLGVFDSFDTDVEDEARRLGAGAWSTLTRVTLPMLRRPLAEAAVLGFLVSWAQVPLTLLVGQGRVRTLTVEVLAWSQAGQDPLAALGALVLAAPPVALIAAVAVGVRRGGVVVP